MDDVMRTNPMTVTSTPTLVAGALTFDANQALQFDGSTDSFSVADSTSLSITGSMTASLFVKLTSTPGSTKTIFDKASSYRLQVDTNRKLLWRLDNGGSNVTVTSNEALTVGQWYHVVCVYNGEYAGSPLFGYNSFGATEEALFGDYTWSIGPGWAATGFNNMQAGFFELPENGILNDLQFNVKILAAAITGQFIRGVVFREEGAGHPGSLLCESETLVMNIPTGSPLGGRNIDGWMEMPINAYATAGGYWLGFIASGVSGTVRYGYETTGGFRDIKAHSLGSPGGTGPAPTAPTGTAPASFGSPAASDNRKLSIFANYTPTSRTGLEGNAYIYIDGAVDNSAAYTSGIANTANALTHATTDAAVSIDEFAIWNRVLSTAEVTTLYRMR